MLGRVLGWLRGWPRVGRDVDAMNKTTVALVLALLLLSGGAVVIGVIVRHATRSK